MDVEESPKSQSQLVTGPKELSVKVAVKVLVVTDQEASTPQLTNTMLQAMSEQLESVTVRHTK